MERILQSRKIGNKVCTGQLAKVVKKVPDDTAPQDVQAAGLDETENPNTDFADTEKAGLSTLADTGSY